MELILVTGILYVLQVSGIDDRGDYKSVLGALKSSGFDPKHIDTLWNIVGAVLHLVSGFVRSLDSLTLFSSRTLFPSRKFFYMEDIVSIKDVFFPIKDIVSIKDTSRLKGIPSKDAGWPENRKCINNSICRLCLVVLSIFRQEKYFFHFEFELSVQLFTNG